MEAKKARVLLVDDHPLFLEGLAAALAPASDFEVIGGVTGACDALAVARDVAIDVAITDIMMPRISGISLVMQLHGQQPDCKVIGLSAIEEPAVIAEMLRAGASGYVLKGQRPAEIIEAIRCVLSGARYLPPRISGAAIDQQLRCQADNPTGRLTAREREVFELLIRGFSNSEIAARLFISRRTVETHRLRITRKLNVHAIVEMQRIAARYGYTS